MKFFFAKNCWQQDIRKREYFLAIIRGEGLVLIICWLFYRSIVLAIILFPLSFLYLYVWRDSYGEKKKLQFANEFQDAAESLSVALRTGYSMENAMVEALKDLRMIYRKDSQMIYELERMIRGVKMKVPTEQVWKEFAMRIDLEEVQSFTEVFIIAKRSGGDIISVLKNTTSQLRDKTEVRREIGIIISEKQLEFRVMTLIPLGIIGYMSLGFPDFMDALYGNWIGVGMMSVCLILYGVAYEIGRRIIKIEV